MSTHFHWPWRQGVSGWTAIDCQDGLFGVSVRIPHDRDTKPQVLRHAALPGVAATAENLTHFKGQIESAGFDWVSVLARTDYQMLLVDKSTVSESEMEQSLRWSISPLIDYPPQEANLSWMDIPAAADHANRTAQVYVIASRRDRINTHVALFERSEINLAAIDIRETGQRNISAALEHVTPESEAGLCLVHAEPNGVQLTVTHNGELYLERYIRESIFNGVQEQNEPAGTHKLDRIALEIQRSINLVQRNFSFLSVDKVLVAPTQKDIGLADHLGSRLGAKVDSIDLGLIFDWPDGSDLIHPEIQAVHFNALGAALRFLEKNA